MALSPGQTIAPNLRLAWMLGEGGMGSVWVADHLTLMTQVAVKFVAARLIEDRVVRARFSQEATAAARIKSPYVVQVFDHGVFDGQPYIAMELLEGEDLNERLRRGALGPVEMGAILHQACKGLAAAHALGIVHRDIKPANLFLTQSAGELVVKVLDFGIAKQTNPESPSFKTATQSVIGTPFYMSPEQIFSQGAVDGRADLWALAVVVYQCMTGVLPFRGDTIGDLCVAIHNGNYRAPSSFPHVDLPGIDSWFSRALTRDAAARFGSARELADAFLALMSAGGAPVYDAGFAPKTQAYDGGFAPKTQAYDGGFAPKTQAYDGGFAPKPQAYDGGFAPKPPAAFAPIAVTPVADGATRPVYTTPSSLPTRLAIPRRARSPLVVLVAAGAVLAVGLSGVVGVALLRRDAWRGASSPPVALPSLPALPSPAANSTPEPTVIADPTMVAATVMPAPCVTPELAPPPPAPAKSGAVKRARAPAAPGIADSGKKHDYGF